jgi:hypothetical protein
MGTQLDQAISAVSAAEATYNSDTQNIANIQTAIATATAPLAPAQAQLATDTTSYVAALNALISAAQDAINAVSPPPGQ